MDVFYGDSKAASVVTRLLISAQRIFLARRALRAIQLGGLLRLKVSYSILAPWVVGEAADVTSLVGALNVRAACLDCTRVLFTVAVAIAVLDGFRLG